jgi:Concanavalin A-like lectin/glucanases superfamily
MSALPRGLLANAAAVCLLTWAPAQDVFHCKFDGGCGTSVINYAAGSPAPAAGTLVTTGTPANAWTAGRFGSALAHGTTPVFNIVDTGWTPVNLTGGISWACWLQIPPTAGGSSINGLFGATGSGCLLVPNLVVIAGWGGSASFSSTALVNLARSGWTHFACTVDGSTRIVTPYLNGTPQATTSLSGPLNWTATSSVVIGRYHTTFQNTLFDIDEFIFANRVMSAAEIAVLATDARAADAPFGTSTGPGLIGNGQRPITGNLAYGMVLTANPGLGLIMFGSNYCSLGGTVSLPASLGVLHPALGGVQGFVDTNLGSFMLVVGAGGTQLPLPLPDFPGLHGYSFFSQALTLDTNTAQFAGSNALAIGIGR